MHTIDDVMHYLQSMREDMHSHSERLDKLTELVTCNATAIKSLTTVQTEFDTRLTEQTKESAELRKEVIAIADHVNKLHNSVDKIDRNAACIRQMQSKLDQHDEQNRSRNIMWGGVRERVGERVFDEVKGLLNDLGVTDQSKYIKSVYRFGKRPALTAHPRPIKIELASKENKWAIF